MIDCDERLDTLLIALYVEIDDHVTLPARSGRGQPKRLLDAELICLAVAQVLLGARSEHHWLRLCYGRLGHLYPYLPNQPGYHKRLKAAAPLLAAVMDHLSRQSPGWHGPVRLIDATPVPCGASRETARRSELAGWAHYGYCAAHSRWYWGLKLYLITTPDGMPTVWCLADPKLGEREVAGELLAHAARTGALRPGLILVGDKGFAAGSSRTWSPPGTGCAWSARTAATRHPGTGPSAGSGSGSNRSTTPSRASWTWNATAAGPPQACTPGSPSGCWPWPPASGTTGPAANPSNDR
jgi:hypothetical protein